MVRALKIIDLSEQGEIQLCLERDDQRRTAPPVPFSNPLDQSQYREIGWYFQDYLDHPFGLAKRRAGELEAGLRNLGRLLFEVLFRSNDEAQSCYATACADGLAGYQLVIVSNRPVFLALPWELLNEPDLGYLASQLSSVVRRLTGEPLPQFNGHLPNEQLNVLMVSPMPPPEQHPAPTPLTEEIPPNPDTNEIPPYPPLIKEGMGGFASLAVETLEVLDSLDAQVTLDFLRPATFAALSDHLALRPQHYHLVHFDGVVSTGPDAIVLEAEDGGGDPVPATQLGRLLAGAGVPVALLNSGGADPMAFHQSWPAAAAGLASGGVPLVVSVPFPLAGPGRALFLQNFYQAMVQGTGAPSAVARARSALMANPHRPTPSGKLVFWDWIGPTVYQSRTYTPEPVVEQQPPAVGLTGAAPELRQS